MLEPPAFESAAPAQAASGSSAKTAAEDVAESHGRTGASPAAGSVLGEAVLLARSALFAATFYVLLVALMIGGLPLLLSSRPALALARTWARLSLGLLRLLCGVRIEFRGVEHRPRGGAILAVKHQSFLETFALILALDDFAYVLKRELLAIPLFGWYLRKTRQIAVERGRHAGALPALRDAVGEALRQGRSVVIFPEGTRRSVGAPPAYKPGVALLCGDGRSGGGMPCTPVALNTGLFWPRRSMKRRPGTVVIEFLPPVSPTLGKRDFMTALQATIEAASDDLVAEAIAADPRLIRSIAKRQPRAT